MLKKSQKVNPQIGYSGTTYTDPTHTFLLAIVDYTEYTRVLIYVNWNVNDDQYSRQF